MPSSDFKVNLETFEEDITQQILEEIDPDMFELNLADLCLKVDYTIDVKINSIQLAKVENDYRAKNEQELKKIPR